MKRSELNSKLAELFGDEDVEIYFESTGATVFTGDFNIFIDQDGDAVIEPKGE